MLDFQDNELGDETEEEKYKRKKLSESLQKTIKRNRDFKHLTRNAG